MSEQNNSHGNLILLRHGQSEWNQKNLFTGWVDVDLIDKGREEAVRGGRLIKESGLLPDVVHTSLLRRAIHTAYLALDGCDRHWIPVRRSWRLNERHYGALQGLDKAATRDKYGDEQFMLWRRSFDTPPPAIEPDDEYAQTDDPRYADLPEVPRTECLKDVIARLMPYWEGPIREDLAAGRTVLVTAHGNSLRALVKHLDGICHVYVDDRADIAKALTVCDNAKTHRYGTCNTMETLLIARGIAAEVLPPLGKLYRDKEVELRVDAAARTVLADAGIGPLVDATEEDWRTEYLAPVLAIKVVDNLDAAIEHINEYSSHHTDAIVTEDHDRAMRFLREVDSASVMVNASTRFADGFEFGLGAEIGISNDKLHARGPVGLEGLTSLKYVVLGHGEGRQ